MTTIDGASGIDAQEYLRQMFERIPAETVPGHATLKSGVRVPMIGINGIHADTRTMLDSRTESDAPLRIFASVADWDGKGGLLIAIGADDHPRALTLCVALTVAAQRAIVEAMVASGHLLITCDPRIVNGEKGATLDSALTRLDVVYLSPYDRITLQTHLAPQPQLATAGFMFSAN